MARIRSIKPEIRRSLVVSSWPYPVRWTFVGLPGYLDDEGRGHDDTRLIKSELYPLDDDMTARKLDKHLQTIADNGPLCRYEVAGQRYLHITTWAEHQRVNRPGPSRIPPCPLHEGSVSPHGTLSESSVNGHGALTEGSRASRAPAEQGAGSKEQGEGAGSREQGTREPRAPGSSGTEQTLLDQHQAEHGPLPTAHLQQLERHITKALLDGAQPEHILVGLAEWRRRINVKPGLLPHLIADAQHEPLGHDTRDADAWVAEQEAKRAAELAAR